MRYASVESWPRVVWRNVTNSYAKYAAQVRNNTAPLVSRKSAVSFRLMGMFRKAIGNYFDPVTSSADRSSFELMVRFAVLAAFTLIRR